jgi:D-mannonate dehydratase
MLDDPGREIFEVIRWFGERGKIFNVHFRNIKGRKLDFMEALGDMDMPRALALYRDVGYRYMLCPTTCRGSTVATPRASPSPIATATSRRCSTRSCRDRVPRPPDIRRRVAAGAAHLSLAQAEVARGKGMTKSQARGLRFCQGQMPAE